MHDAQEANNMTRSAGFGLVELMLGVALGLTVVWAAQQAYHTQHQAWLLLQDSLQMLHNANAAFDRLQTSVQIADGATLQAAGHGRVTLQTPPSQDWLLSEGNHRSDALAISHFSALYAFDCQGNTIPPTQSLPRARDSYQLNDKQELTCKNDLFADATFQAIAEGVEDVQLMFAQRTRSTTQGDSELWQWRRADQLGHTADVVAIEICLRMVSPRNGPASVADLPVATGGGCRGEPLPSDGKLRRVLRRVVAVRAHL